MLRTRVKPSSKERFEAVAAQRGLSSSDALREAAIEWISKNERRRA